MLRESIYIRRVRMKPGTLFGLLVLTINIQARSYTIHDYHEPQLSGWITAWSNDGGSYLDHMLINGEAAKLVLQSLIDKGGIQKEIIDDALSLELLEVSFEDWTCVKKVKIGSLKGWLTYNYQKMATRKIKGDVVCRRPVFGAKRN